MNNKLTPTQRFELENITTFRDRPAGFNDRCILHDMGLIAGAAGRIWALTEAGKDVLAAGSLESMTTVGEAAHTGGRR